MSDWQRIKFEDLLVGKKISYGVVQPGEFQTVGGVPLIRVNNIKGSTIDVADLVHIHPEVESKYSKTRLNGGELLIVVVGSGSVGTCIIAPDSLKGFNVARAISVAKLVESVDKHFIAYQFQTEDIKYQLYGNTNDTAQPTLNLSELKQIQFVLPPLPEQKAIASVLSSLDDKIDLLHRQNKTLEAMAETLFRQWFIEEAKEDWEKGELCKLITIFSGYPFKSSSFTDNGKYKLITIKAVQDGYLELSNADEINELPDQLPNYCFLEKGDILLSLTGNVGRCCLADRNLLLLNQRVAKLFPKSSRDLAFTYFMFRQGSMKAVLEEMAKGTAQANLSPIETAKLEILLPPEPLLEKFSKVATPLLNKILENKVSIRTLEKLRDTLLPKLMSGEVRVQFKQESAA